MPDNKKPLQKGTDFVCEMCGGVAVTLEEPPNCPLCKYEFPPQFSGRELVLALHVKRLQEQVRNLRGSLLELTQLMQAEHKLIDNHQQQLELLSKMVKMKS